MTNTNSNAAFLGVKPPPNDNTSMTNVPSTPKESEKKDTYSVASKAMEEANVIDILGTPIDISKADEVKTYEDVKNLMKVNPKTGYANIVFPPSEVEKMFTDAYQNRVTNIAKNRFSDATVDFSGVGTESETSALLNELTDGEIQKALGFIDTDEEAINYLNNKIGAGNFRIFSDENSAITEPNRWISIKREDGTFTPFSPATKTYTDIFNRLLPQIEYEGRNMIYNQVVSIASSNVAGKLTNRLPAPIKGAVMFLTYAYSLYGGGKKTEAGRKFIKEELNITNPEDIDEAENWLSNFTSKVAEFAYRAVPGATLPGTGTFTEELAGLLEATGVGTASIRPWLEIATDAVKTKFLGSLKRTQEATAKLFGVPRQDIITDVRTFVAKTNEEKSRAIKMGTNANGEDIYANLEDLILPQAVFNRIIDRFGSLAEQSSTVIPDKLRSQMQSAVAYLSAYQKKEVGPGDIKEFRKAINDLGAYLSGGYREGDKLFDVPRTKVGQDLSDLDSMYLLLRTAEANVLYGDIFKKLGNAKYNLDDINNAISKQFKAFVPKTPPSREVTQDVIEGAIPSDPKGGFLLKKLMYEISTIGTSRKTGRILTPDGIRQAAKKFGELEENAGFVFNIDDITTPAELLHLYARRLGELSRDTYGPGGSIPDKVLERASRDIRNAILDTIAKPVNNPNKADLTTIAKDLKYANDFYKATFDTTAYEILTSVRMAKNVQINKPESAKAIYKLLGGPGKDVGEPITETIQSIQKMEAYVSKEVSKILQDMSDGRTLDDIKKRIADKDLVRLKDSVRKIISQRLGRAAGLDEGVEDSTTSAMAYIDSLGDAAELLGITRENRATILQQANSIARLKKLGVFELGQNPIGFANDIEFKLIFDDIVEAGNKKESAERFGSMIALLPEVGGGKATENLRKGLMEYIISPESGVLKTQGKQSPYAAVGDTLIDNDRLIELLQQIKGIPNINKVLTDIDFEVLDTISLYVGIIKNAGTDAGAALSGAQIISGLYTLSPKQLLGSIGRLAAQKRMSDLLTDPRIVDILTGGKLDAAPMTVMEKYEKLLIGPTTLGGIAAQFVFEGFGRNENEQTNFMLNEPSNRANNAAFLGVQAPN